MDTVSIYDAKAQFSQLVDRALEGEDVVISRHGRPVARLTRIEAPAKLRFGFMKGLQVPDDFDAPLPDEVLKLFDGAAAG